MMKRTVLVLGATGTQGGAVARALLERGHAVIALVRSAGSPKSTRLRDLGARLAIGNFDDEESIIAAAAGADATFVNTSPFVPGVGFEGERRQARTIVRALGQAAVPHVVYSSISDADRKTGVAHFDNKWDAEQALAVTGLAVTVTAPVFFSDNLIQPWAVPALRTGVLHQALPGTRSLQVVSVRDIGRFNAAVLERGPQELAGERINYAGDALSPVQMASELSRATGRQIDFVQQPFGELAAFGEDMVSMYRWFDEVGYSAELEAMQQRFPEVEWQTFRDWAQAQAWHQILA